MDLSLVKVNLHTGRHHQIRVQLSNFCHSIFGDQKYGTRGKTEAQLMYGMWFRPQSVLNYLQTGKDNYKDKQGTSLDRIFSKMS